MRPKKKFDWPMLGVPLSWPEVERKAQEEFNATAPILALLSIIGFCVMTTMIVAGCMQ